MEHRCRYNDTKWHIGAVAAPALADARSTVNPNRNSNPTSPSRHQWA
jgi:hypothetical protein